jgi:hypothetical protein
MPGGIVTDMESLVRPWIPITSKSSPADKFTGPPQETPPAYIRWGAASQFASSDFRSLANANPGFNTQDDQKPKRKRLNYSESARSYEDIRVENPDDSGQYVILRVASGMVLSGPDGETAVFSMTVDSGIPGTVEGSGQTPDSPPLSEIE